MQKLIDQSQDVFSQLPSRMQLIRYYTYTVPGMRVNIRPYHIPEAHHEAIQSEVRVGCLQQPPLQCRLGYLA
ncbi:hypothetical protein AAFF_G00358440 [Aldrovandia affinis]|uniref:Uncharacterized protein n=1 Tax=Aldrovandia affinis TaxID=143900 RepID=A0AAD7TAF8_9TELE|nr:hypothetical protein AAFF_G00358440 [Aldrovandia affinis]